MVFSAILLHFQNLILKTRILHQEVAKCPMGELQFLLKSFTKQASVWMGKTPSTKHQILFLLQTYWSVYL